MSKLALFGKKLQCLCSFLYHKLASLSKSTLSLISYFYRSFLLKLNPFWVHVWYSVSLSFVGFWVLKDLKPRTDSFTPRNLDLFFTSVSATTVSSSSTVEMEVFSNAQLMVLTVLMFLGGRVFTSMVGLHFLKSKLSSNKEKMAPCSKPADPMDQIELGVVVYSAETGVRFQTQIDQKSHDEDDDFSLKYSSIKFLVIVVLVYLVVVHVIGLGMVSLYVFLVSSAAEVLKRKGIKAFTFCVFTTVSSLASCGFIPTNENMVVFRQNSGLLLILIPQILVGNTLFPCCLRSCVWVLGKLVKKTECEFLLEGRGDVGYLHLLPRLHSILLVPTVFGFVLIQFVLFCSVEWNSDSLRGLNSYQKVIGVMFQSVNSRHAGETIVDLSIISPAILVLFILMMYLPPYTSFLPIKDDRGHQKSRGRRKRSKGKVVEDLIFSQPSYLVIFIILVCITERKKLKEDPLNFSVFNIVLEVISAYGNVGYTTGYSCKRQLHLDGNCQDKWFGFSGRWSDEGKIVLIIVMFFGRLKKFNMDGGKAWILR